MINLKKLEKSRGAVIFATNTELIDYQSIANLAAKLIKFNLNLPTTILSGTIANNKRYDIDKEVFTTWYNNGRYLAYEQSPYDQTLLIDCDYFVLDQNLNKIFDSLQDYKIFRHNKYVDGTNTSPMGKYSLPHLWATAIVFEKTEKTKMLFELVAKIERNYEYYRKLFNISTSTFRNDYAFAIADLVINGYAQDNKNYIPWPMLTIPTKIDYLKLKEKKIYLKTDNKGYVLPKQNLHIMSKKWLSSKECLNFVEDILGA